MEVVFVVRGDIVDMVKVCIGVQDDFYIQVRIGLEIGDQVISGFYFVIVCKLKEGEVVCVVVEDDFYKEN